MARMNKTIFRAKLFSFLFITNARRSDGERENVHLLLTMMTGGCRLVWLVSNG